MKITIVTPSYNQAQFLDRTIQSVLDQNYEDLEYFVVDGGSTDGSREIIERYSDRISWWVSEPDRGQTHAINKGMSRATGQICAYLNSDDMLLPGALHAVAEVFRADPQAGLVHGRCITVDEQDRQLARSFFGDIDTTEKILDLWQVWFNGMNVVQPEVFWSKRMADRIGPFDETRHYAMDYDYWTRLIIGGAKVLRLDRDIAAFRIWAAQKSTASDAAADELRAIAIKLVCNPDVPLPAAVRRRLKRNWLFDEKFRKAALQISQSANSALERRLGVLMLAARNPELIANPAFRRHVKGTISRWDGQTLRQAK